MPESQFTNIAERVAHHLSPFLGKHTAKTAVETFCKKSLDKGADQLTAADVPGLLEGLRPLLLTFAGGAATDALFARIRADIKS